MGKKIYLLFNLIIIILALLYLNFKKKAFLYLFSISSIILHLKKTHL